MDGGLSQLLSNFGSAQDDKDSQWLNYAAGALSGQTAADSMAGALKGLAATKSKQDELKAQYLPHVTQALLEANKLQNETDKQNIVSQLVKHYTGLDMQNGQAQSPQIQGTGQIIPQQTQPSGPLSQIGQTEQPSQQMQGYPKLPFGLVLGLKAMGGADLTDLYKIQSDPLQIQGGTTTVDRVTGQRSYTPKYGEGLIKDNNGNVIFDQGYQDAILGLEGAKSLAQEKAKAAYNLLPKDYAAKNGAPIGGSVLEYLGGQGSSNGLPPIPAPGQSMNSMQLPSIPSVPMPGQLPPIAQNGQMPSPIPAMQAAQPGRPELQSEAEKAQQMASIDTLKSNTQGLNKNWIDKIYQPVKDQADSANRIVTALDAIKNIDMKTGWGTDARANAANVLTSLGIASDKTAEFASNAQKFQNIAMQRLQETLNAATGPQTEGDAKRGGQTFAQLSNTPEANQFISDYARAIANQRTNKAAFYDDAIPIAQRENNGDFTQIDREWRKRQHSIWDDPIMQKWKKGSK